MGVEARHVPLSAWFQAFWVALLGVTFMAYISGYIYTLLPNKPLLSTFCNRLH